MAVVVHDDGDDAYLDWMRMHPGGFVLNLRRVGAERNATVHRSGCAHIRVLRNVANTGGFTRGGVLKVCAGTLQEILQYLGSNRTGPSVKVLRCRSCEPSPADLTIERLAEEVAPSLHNSPHVLAVLVNAYEQDPVAKLCCIQAHGTLCKVCSLDLERIYGKLGATAIHVHFLPAIERLDERFVFDPVRDLLPICPTCHTMLHRGRDEALDVEDLKLIMEHARRRWQERLMREY